jgi:regulator of protease activity HflC (stomatin/prohibitin superfamily)
MSELPGSDSEDPIAAAAERLSRAVMRVGARLDALTVKLTDAQADLSASRHTDVDRTRLAEALDTAQAREKELLTAIGEAEASVAAALGELEPLLRAPESEGER